MSNRLASTSVSDKSNSTQTLPMLNQLLRSDHPLPWQMNPAEQAMMIYLLERLRPKVAIEIGTRFGGSLQVIAQYSERVYSLDIDPEVTDRLKGRFPNVEYLIGPSDQTLPARSIACSARRRKCVSYWSTATTLPRDCVKILTFSSN